MKQFKLSSSRFLLVLMCVSAGLWIAFAKLVVPPIIESAYRGESSASLQQYDQVAAYPFCQLLPTEMGRHCHVHYLVSLLGFWLLIR